MINAVNNYNWQINTAVYSYHEEHIKWTPYIYPRYTNNQDIDKIQEYQKLSRPKYFYDWTLGKTVDIWV